MTEERCSRGHAIADLVDYWVGDVDREQAERIENCIFDCAECGERLADIEAMSRGLSEVVRAGRFHSVVTESLLNRLSRDGMRIRTYTLDPGTMIPCAVWADDDLVVSRLRGDFARIGSTEWLCWLAQRVGEDKFQGRTAISRVTVSQL